MLHNSPIRSSLLLAILSTLCPQVSALDLYGNTSGGQVTIENPTEEYSKVIGWTVPNEKNELVGGSVTASNLHAFRIFGAEYSPSESVESITVTNNRAIVENVDINTNETFLYLGGADVQALQSTTVNITAESNSLKVKGTLSGSDENKQNLNLFGAHVSSQTSDPASEIILKDNKVELNDVTAQGWKAIGITGGDSFSKETTPTALSGNRVDIVGSVLHATNLMWGTKNGPLGLVEKGLKSSTF